MLVKYYVGNLPWSVGDAELEGLFSEQGEVLSAIVVNDRDTGRSRGFGFVEMDVEDSGAAVSSLNGREVDGRALVVNQAS